MITIIGAGIGGLTTAIFLKRAGIKFQIFEAAEQIKPVGAGIMLAVNAMQIYQKLGLAPEIIRRGNIFTDLNITNQDLEILSQVNISTILEETKTPNVAIHRAALHEILVKEVGEENIHLNKRLRDINKINGLFELHFEDGTQSQVAYLIGADGIHSPVRNILFPQSGLRAAHQICWRGITKNTLNKSSHHAFYEAWGKGKRFGYVVLNDQEIYWYLLINDTMGNLESKPNDYVDSFFPLASSLIKSTSSESIIVAKLFDLAPIEEWSLSKVCLLGDAAHATTPNLGQGACQAIEDAYTLGELLMKYTIDQAFEMYPKIRKRKAHTIVKTSWSVGKLSHLNNPLLIFLRNCIMKSTPKRVMEQRLKRMYSLEKIP